MRIRSVLIAASKVRDSTVLARGETSSGVAPGVTITGVGQISSFLFFESSSIDGSTDRNRIA